MTELKFEESKNLSIGIELELQLIHPETYDLSPQINQLLQEIKTIEYAGEIKPEITHSMVEINSSPHEKITCLHDELLALNQIIITHAKKLDILLSGGGVHPFQNWRERIIFPNYKDVYQKYDFLMKKFTIFGQHVHVGCADANDAIYLIHAFSRYIPHFIALNASSPFYEREETQFDSVRLHIVDAFPLSGTLPFLTSWDEFIEHYNQLEQRGIIKKVGNLYWDIRPQPQYGTLEIRIFDTPLTLMQAITTAAYVQTLAFYLLEERPFELDKSMYLSYAYNRFQAARFGFNGIINNYPDNISIPIQADILDTLKRLKPYAKFLGTDVYMDAIMETVTKQNNDANKIRIAYKELNTMEELVMYQSACWMEENNNSLLNAATSRVKNR
jgi:carboxylate-amine ligase